jgi:hypothetical protein
MTLTNQNNTATKNQFPINRLLYGGFVLTSIYFLATKDISSALANLGISLAFDPFDQKVAWKDIPAYQKRWIVVHVSAILGLLATLLIQKF